MHQMKIGISKLIRCGEFFVALICDVLAGANCSCLFVCLCLQVRMSYLLLRGNKTVATLQPIILQYFWARHFHVECCCSMPFLRNCASSFTISCDVGMSQEKYKTINLHNFMGFTRGRPFEL